MAILKYWTGSAWVELSGAPTPGPWLALPLNSGFVEYNAANTPQYRFEPYNMVRLRGWVKPSSGNFAAAGANPAILPAGAYNTSRFVDYACAHGNVAGTTARGLTIRAEIANSSGTISLIWTTSPQYDPVSWVSFDGWTFSLDP
jgi:hypothetical protein